MPKSSFESLPDYIALPRVESLALSPDGTRVVLSVATLSKDGTKYERALWSIPADGAPGARRLTRSAKGESAPVFTASGDLLFTSTRPDADADDETGQLWLLPAAGGEARPVTRLAGGVSGIQASAEGVDRVVFGADLLPSAETLEDDAKLRAARKKSKVSAILHEGYPVRYWDADLGPDEPHLLVLDTGDLVDQVGVERAADAVGDADIRGAASTDRSDTARGAEPASTAKEDVPEPYPASLPRPKDLTPHPGRGGAEGVAVTPDGTTVIASLPVPDGYDRHHRLVAIDVESGRHGVLLDESRVDLEMPSLSHDGRVIAYLRTVRATPQAPTQQELWVAGVARTEADGAVEATLIDPRRLAADWDRWPSSLQFDVDDRSLIVTADQDGRGPVFRIPLGGGSVQQLTDDDFTYSDVGLDLRTGDVVALRSSWMAAPHPVRIARDGTVTPLAVPGGAPDVPAHMEEVETAAADGARVRGWLLLPATARAGAPAPLLLWIHGGPLNSWNAWSWRWNPQLAVARGYAVLLPDPALSTGYGLDFVARGWNAWGGAPFTDLMSITDAVVARDDIDETRTAAMGGSFGGYMANWVAGHTDRFRAIVTHASLWALDQFVPTTDDSAYWASIFTQDGLEANSPHRHIDNIVTPMLVVHGDSDYRVPIGEGLRLWSELNARFAEPDGTLPHRFLYFPDENHWVLKPQHAVVWYETVFAFLGQHVLGDDWRRPANLG
ncbi:S9 family peptidase [Rathayibacter sp. CAU 1779]